MMSFIFLWTHNCFSISSWLVPRHCRQSCSASYRILHHDSSRVLSKPSPRDRSPYHRVWDSRRARHEFSWVDQKG